ncbi:MAG: HD-GYP domain-containing protein, partial [Humidesulfovibrio sp.]|nr:HD-GYP domain-containing protein [Humidesulfovibrio sp.]
IVTEINTINASRPTVKILFDPWMRRKAAVAVDLLHDDGGLEIRECLNPAGYPVDLTTLLLA